MTDGDAGAGRDVSRHRRAVAWVLALAWAGFLFVQSSSSEAGSFLARLPEGSDKVVHAIAYAVLAALLTYASGRPVLSVLAAVAYGVSDEVHQAFVPGRSSDVFDLLADAVGAGIGAWTARALWRMRTVGARRRG